MERRECEKKKIVIPEGRFESNCEVCKHGYNEADGLYCAMYRRTIMSGEMDYEKCPQYKMRLKEKIKAGIGIYFALVGIYLIVSMISCMG